MRHSFIGLFLFTLCLGVAGAQSESEFTDAAKVWLQKLLESKQVRSLATDIRWKSYQNPKLARALAQQTLKLLQEKSVSEARRVRLAHVSSLAQSEAGRRWLMAAVLEDKRELALAAEENLRKWYEVGPLEVLGKYAGERPQLFPWHSAVGRRMRRALWFHQRQLLQSSHPELKKKALAFLTMLAAAHRYYRDPWPLALSAKATEAYFGALFSEIQAHSLTSNSAKLSVERFHFESPAALETAIETYLKRIPLQRKAFYWHFLTLRRWSPLLTSPARQRMEDFWLKRAGGLDSIRWERWGSAPHYLVPLLFLAGSKTTDAILSRMSDAPKGKALLGMPDPLWLTTLARSERAEAVAKSEAWQVWIAEALFEGEPATVRRWVQWLRSPNWVSYRWKLDRKFGSFESLEEFTPFAIGVFEKYIKRLSSPSLSIGKRLARFRRMPPLFSKALLLLLPDRLRVSFMQGYLSHHLCQVPGDGSRFYEGFAQDRPHWERGVDPNVVEGLHFLQRILVPAVEAAKGKPDPLLAAYCQQSRPGVVFEDGAETEALFWKTLNDESAGQWRTRRLALTLLASGRVAPALTRKLVERVDLASTLAHSLWALLPQWKRFDSGIVLLRHLLDANARGLLSESERAKWKRQASGFLGNHGWHPTLTALGASHQKTMQSARAFFDWSPRLAEAYLKELAKTSSAEHAADLLDWFVAQEDHLWERHWQGLHALLKPIYLQYLEQPVMEAFSKLAMSMHDVYPEWHAEMVDWRGKALGTLGLSHKVIREQLRAMGAEPKLVEQVILRLDEF